MVGTDDARDDFKLARDLVFAMSEFFGEVGDAVESEEDFVKAERFGDARDRIIQQACAHVCGDAQGSVVRQVRTFLFNHTVVTNRESIKAPISNRFEICDYIRVRETIEFMAGTDELSQLKWESSVTLSTDSAFQHHQLDLTESQGYYG